MAVLLLACLLEVLHVGVQTVEALVPEPLEPAGPLVDRSQPAGVEAVQALLARLAVPHQPDLPEHPQVLGRARLGHPQLLGQLGHRPLTRPQQHQDLPALRLGDRVEDVRRRRCSCHGTSYSGQGGPTHEDPAVLGAISAPVLVLVGSDTKPYCTAYAQHVADHAPDARVHEIQGVGHAAPLTHPAALAEPLTEFFLQALPT
jgi:pimeloyl-ACP methyl ester carboxylesterase